LTFRVESFGKIVQPPRRSAQFFFLSVTGWNALRTDSKWCLAIRSFQRGVLRHQNKKTNPQTSSSKPCSLFLLSSLSPSSQPSFSLLHLFPFHLLFSRSLFSLSNLKSLFSTTSAPKRNLHFEWCSGGTSPGWLGWFRFEQVSAFLIIRRIATDATVFTL